MHLFEELQVREVTLRNRIVVSPLNEMLEPPSEARAELAAKCCSGTWLADSAACGAFVRFAGGYNLCVGTDLLDRILRSH